MSNAFYMILLGRQNLPGLPIKYSAIYVSKYNYLLIIKKNQQSLETIEDVLKSQHPNWFGKIERAKAYLALLRQDLIDNGSLVHQKQTRVFLAHNKIFSLSKKGSKTD